MSERHNLAVIDRRVAMALAGSETMRATVGAVSGRTASVWVGGALLPAIVPLLSATLVPGDVVEMSRPRGVGGALHVDAVLQVPGRVSSVASLVGLSAGRTITDEVGGEDDFAYAHSGRKWSIFDGSYAFPVTAAGPTVRIVRHEQISRATQPNPADNSYNAALHVFSQGNGNDTAQVTGIQSQAQGGSTTAGNDLCGVLALARMNTAGGVGVAAGLYAEGRRDYDTSLATMGIESRSNNHTATDSTYNSGGPSPVMNIWATLSGTAKTGAIFQARALDAAAIALVGIGFNAGTVQDSTFRDDTSSVTSVDVRGSHVVGVNMLNATLSGGAMFLPNGIGAGINFMNAAASALLNSMYMDGSNNLVLGTGAAAVVVPTALYVGAHDIVTDTSTGTKIGTGATQKIGFYGHATIAQQTGVAVSAAGIHAALVALGLFTA